MILTAHPTTVHRPGDIGDLIDACAELRAELSHADERIRQLDAEIAEADNAFEALATAALRLLDDLDCRADETTSHPDSFWRLADIIGWRYGDEPAAAEGGAA